MPKCQCGAHVSARYFRVFALDGHLEQCLECVDSRQDLRGDTR